MKYMYFWVSLPQRPVSSNRVTNYPSFLAGQLKKNDSQKFSSWTNYPKMIAWGRTIYYLISIQYHFHRMKEKEEEEKSPETWEGEQIKGEQLEEKKKMVLKSTLYFFSLIGPPPKPP